MPKKIDKWKMLLGSTVVALSSLGCSKTDEWLWCSTELQAELPSPSGDDIAAVFHRECDLTTPPNTQVSLRRRTSVFHPGEGRVLTLEGRHQLQLLWGNNHELKVIIPKTHVFNSQPKWEHVKISYETSH